ncbi:MAG: hypothetical protein HC815_27595 [Richelia sp. RM1_1_1]|nr:hypothetical protein [Richelia sp. RM1_1_1]
MQNGYVLVQEPLPAPSIEEDYCWLPAPTALSTRGSRPPGLNKLETFLKKNELINKGEVLNPVILAQWFSIPSTWLDPSESRTATELFALNAAPPEISSTPELGRSPSVESCTSTHSSNKGKKRSSDCWYTPPHIVELVIQVLGQIDLDPCADDGKHIPATTHFTFMQDGLAQPWHGRVFMNPPYSCPGAWMKKLQTEFESGRVREALHPKGVSEAIALVPAATDTKWLSPVLKSQPVCFWTGRIKFLDEDYKPKLAARQSHVLVYWGENWERFKEVFDPYGVVYLPSSVDRVLMVNSTVSTNKQEKSEPVLMVNSTVSTDKQEKSESVLMVNSTVSTTRRSRGAGAGRIQMRTITKKSGKQYQQAWYDWQMSNGGKTISKSTYISKRLLPKVQQLEINKAPVKEILHLLGVMFN